MKGVFLIMLEKMDSSPNQVDNQNDLIFDCPECHQNLVVKSVAAGHTVACPHCGHSILVPHAPKVVALSEAPETQQLQSLPAWKQELLSTESALREIKNQREEAGNSFKHHSSEANRLKLRIGKLDSKLQDLEFRRIAIKREHPEE